MALEAGYEDPDIMHVLTTRPIWFQSLIHPRRITLGEFHESGVHLTPISKNYDEAFVMYREYAAVFCIVIPSSSSCSGKAADLGCASGYNKLGRHVVLHLQCCSVDHDTEQAHCTAKDM
jgi:hypothetical protein